MQNAAAILKNNLAALQMVKQSYMIQDSIPKYTHKKNENISPYRNLHMNIHAALLIIVKK